MLFRSRPYAESLTAAGLVIVSNYQYGKPGGTAPSDFTRGFAGGVADGVRIHGCTVHFVTPEVDHGPIVAQGAVPVRDSDDEATLAARVLAVEHRLLPAAVRAFCTGRLVIAGNRVRVKGELVPAAALEVPSPGF